MTAATLPTLPTLRPSTGVGRSKLENEILRTLRSGGDLPELRRLAEDEALLRTLRSLEAEGVVDRTGRLVEPSR